MVDLPVFPTVCVVEDKVVIEYSDGKRVLWGRETSEVKAKKVAETLELELKIFDYIEKHVDESLLNIRSSLNTIASDSLLDELINEVILLKGRS